MKKVRSFLTGVGGLPTSDRRSEKPDGLPVLDNYVSNTFLRVVTAAINISDNGDLNTTQDCIVLNGVMRMEIVIGQ